MLQVESKGFIFIKRGKRSEKSFIKQLLDRRRGGGLICGALGLRLSHDLVIRVLSNLT